jgi:hypothetical protein
MENCWLADSPCKTHNVATQSFRAQFIDEKSRFTRVHVERNHKAPSAADFCQNNLSGIA